MSLFSKSCQYALQGILFVAYHEREGNKVSLKNIAETQEIPAHFLSKILQQLVKHKILVSTKGLGGGFTLAQDADKIRLLDVVKAIDGMDLFDRCGIGFQECSDDAPCPIHSEFKQVKNRIRNLLTEKTLKDLCDDVDKGESLVTLKS